MSASLTFPPAQSGAWRQPPQIQRQDKPLLPTPLTQRPQLIDIGANLNNKKFENDMPEILERAWKNRVGSIIVTGTTLKGSQDALEIVKKYNTPDQIQLYSTVGIHPHYSASYRERQQEELKTLLSDPRVVAIGECGLDYNRMFSPKERQQDCFAAHLKLAKDIDKPLFLHERDAHTDFVKMLKQYQPSRMVVHCYTGGREEVQEYLDLGAYIGVTGWICDNRRNAPLLDALKIIPLDKLMIETDAPYLAPFPNSARNEPANLYHVAKRISAELQIPYGQLCYQLTMNTKKFFAIP